MKVQIKVVAGEDVQTSLLGAFLVTEDGGLYTLALCSGKDKSMMLQDLTPKDVGDFVKYWRGQVETELHNKPCDFEVEQEAVELLGDA